MQLVVYRKRIFMFIQKKSVIVFILCGSIITPQLYSMAQKNVPAWILAATSTPQQIAALKDHFGLCFLPDVGRWTFESMFLKAQIAQALLTKVDQRDVLYPELTKAITEFKASWPRGAKNSGF